MDKLGNDGSRLTGSRLIGTLCSGRSHAFARTAAVRTDVGCVLVPPVLTCRGGGGDPVRRDRTVPRGIVLVVDLGDGCGRKRVSFICISAVFYRDGSTNKRTPV